MKIDLLCSDYEKAKRNRRMVKLKQNISAYLYIESLVKGWPRNKPLPSYLLGTLPHIGKKEERELRGFHEVKE